MGYMYFHLFRRFSQPKLICTTRNRRAHGFTLLEVMVVVAILGVLAALAGPSFTSIMERWRVRQAVESMTSTLYYARSEAIKRGGHVAIQKLPNNTNGCTLASTNEEWGCGWFVFLDADGNGDWSSKEEILQTVSAPPNTNVDRTKKGASVSLNRYGMMDGLNLESFVIFPAFIGKSSPATRTICTASGGRIKVSEGHSCS